MYPAVFVGLVGRPSRTTLFPYTTLFRSTVKGGNTDELYRQDATFDGRLAMARSLQLQHPDVTKVVRKWGRWQHHVDYRRSEERRVGKECRSRWSPQQ